MTTLIEIPHEKHGSIMLAKNGTIIDSTSKSDENNIEVLTAELRGATITSVYKPPPTPFVMPEIPSSGKPKIVIGDFNSHSQAWAERSQLNLIHDAKQPKSFNSGRWKAGYNPDIVFVSQNITGLSKKLVLEPLPKTQHRPIGLTVNAAITPATVPFQRRFNFRKANWPAFQQDLERKIAHLPVDPNNYDNFTKIVHQAA